MFSYTYLKVVISITLQELDSLAALIINVSPIASLVKQNGFKYKVINVDKFQSYNLTLDHTF